MKRLSRLSILVVLLLSGVLAFGQGKSVAPNENLVVQGIPPIPASLTERADRYTNSRSAAIMSWHPTRREMLISTRFADTIQIHLVKFPGGARTQLTFFPDRVLGAIFQPKLGNYFLFMKDVGGGEWYQLFRYDMADGNITMLTDGKSRNLPGRWNNKGDLFSYASTRRDGRDVDFWVMNPADPSTNRMITENSGGGWGMLDWSPDDKTILASEYISVNESRLWLVDVATGKKTLATPESTEKVAYQGIGFSADGKGIYLTTDKDNEFQRLALLDIATKKLTYLTHYSWDIEQTLLSPNRKLVAYTINENGTSVLHVLNLVSNKEVALPRLPVGIIAGFDWRDNNEELGFSLNSARSPSDVYSFDLRTGKVDRWTYSESGGLNTQTFVEPELIKWKSFDGLEISGWLYKPPARFTGRRPVIIDIHGGPEGEARPYFLARDNYFLNELGVALIFPNVRGSTGFGKTFVALDNGYKRVDSYKDIEALLDWIKTQPELDANKIMVTGGSYGGHMTLAIATRDNDRIACSLDVVGMSNLVTFLEHTEPYRRDLRRAEYGDERDPKMRAFLESIAPMNHVQNITKPIFIVAGANDPRVPKSEADQIVAALQKEGTPVWYLVGKNEGHGFSKKANADYQFYATILFIEKYLLGKDVGEPVGAR